MTALRGFPKWNKSNIIFGWKYDVSKTLDLYVNLIESGEVKLVIYNIKGQKVKTLMDCYTSSGDFELIWNGKDDNNKPVSSGIYLYKLQVNDKTLAARKCILLKWTKY